MPIRIFGRAGAVAIAALLLGGCAARPARIEQIAPGELQRRYLERLTSRETAARGLDADLNLWYSAHGRRAPGVEGTLLMAAPDRIRLRVGALFGTAVDAGVQGERVRVVFPGKDAVWETDAADPPIEVIEAGGWLVSAWSAAWRPPASAWATGTWSDSLHVLGWHKDADSVSVGIGASGLPRIVTVVRDGRALRITYAGWRHQDGVVWPDRFSVGDPAGSFELEARLRIIWFRETPEERLWPSVEEGMRHLEWEDVAALIEGGLS